MKLANPECRVTMRNRPSVLIIESRQNTRTFMEMVLSQEGMRVFSAVSLCSALLQLRVLQPDLIIIGFDGQAGEGVAAKIHVLSAAPLLVLGDGNGVTPGPGVSDVLPYPYGAGELCAKVAGLLGEPVETHS
jgi:DNA-binding response OmpR family regulator